MSKARNILIHLSTKYDGDWFRICRAIEQKEFNSKEVIDETVANMKCKAVTLVDDDYPQVLRQMYHPPFTLFYYGDLSLVSNYSNNLAVVGSRKNSDYGKITVERIIKELNNEFIIISGMAAGIDSIAHRAAIATGGKTVGILGSGIDNCYPIDNKDIYEEMKENHLIISEYPGMSEPAKTHFPMRNRLIAALSYGVLVGEASKKSGTVITVMHALENGREVMAIPYPADIDSECNEVIRTGATLVTCGEHVSEAMSNLSKKS